ncbi:MAG: hypothetical protein ACJAR3_002160 [Roseivirga sp.]
MSLQFLAGQKKLPKVGSKLWQIAVQGQLFIGSILTPMREELG